MLYEYARAGAESRAYFFVVMEPKFEEIFDVEYIDTNIRFNRWKKQANQIQVSQLPRFGNKSKICGVYFLFLKNKLVYIGKSVDIKARLKKHRKNKEFDEYTFIVMPEKSIDLYERFFLDKYQPILNNDNQTIMAEFERDIKSNLYFGKVIHHFKKHEL